MIVVVFHKSSTDQCPPFIKSSKTTIESGQGSAVLAVRVNILSCKNRSTRYPLFEPNHCHYQSTQN